MNFSTPYVQVDLNKVEKNIKTMIAGLDKAGIDHWPHIKTHKSIEFAKKQIELGAKGITVAKLSEAEIMDEGGIKDILIAFPIIGDEKLQRLGKLNHTCNLRTIVDSFYVAKGLSEIGEKSNKEIQVLIEIDGGSHRGGIQPEEVLPFAKDLSTLSGIELIGVFTYAGQIYGDFTVEKVRQIAKMEADILIEARNLLNRNGFNIMVTSGGSTPSSFYAEQLKGISESRAGNYIFGDMKAVHMGVTPIEDVALRLFSTVVSKPLPGYATIDAGSKTLTTELPIVGETYGYVVGKPEVQIVQLNEEHGYLRFDPDKHDLKIGEVIEIIPNHSCVIPNLNDSIYAVKNGEFAKHLKIDARGRNN